MIELNGADIIRGNEDKWLRMMLDDEDSLKKMGLPSNMTESQKDQFVVDMMEAKGAQEKAAADQRANRPSGIVGAQVGYRDLVVGEKYLLTFPNGKEVETKLNRTMSVSCAGDYVFENIKGGDSLVGHSGMMGANEFPIPIALLASAKINELS